MKLLFLLLLSILTLFAQNIEVLEAKYFLDPEHRYSVDDVYRDKTLFSQALTPSTKLGFKEDTVWIYLRPINQSVKAKTHIIQFTYPLHDNLEVHKFINGTATDVYTTGDQHPFESRELKTHAFAIPYVLQTGETEELIFKINSKSLLNIGIEVLPLETYYSRESSNKLFFGVYYGALLIMVLYNLILYFTIRESVYLHYVQFHFANLLLQFVFNGLAFQYLYPDFPGINSYLIPIMFALVNYFAIVFGVSFLRINSLLPKTSIFLSLLALGSLLHVVLSFVLPYAFILKSISIFMLFTLLSLIASSIYLYHKFHNAESKLFIAALSFLLGGITIEQIMYLGYLPMNSFTQHAFLIGSFIELALFSFALAYRYSSVFNKLTATEFDLRRFNKDLEKTIAVRTKTLHQKNHQLSLEVNNKNILLREVYHRVKNNLQIISSLLSLQSMRLSDKPSKTMFDESIQRIKAMAMVHEKLYQSEDIEILEMQSYTQSLVNELQQSFHLPNLHFEITCESIHLNLEVAVPIGLIINELVTNALKYAFEEKQKEKVIKLKMQTTTEGTLLLEVYDNGRGADIATLQKGFGFKLIESLAAYQLKGNIQTFNDNGLHHRLTFTQELTT